MEAVMAGRTRPSSWRAKSGGRLLWCGSRKFREQWRFCAKDTAGWRRTAVVRRRSVPQAKVPSECPSQKEATMRGLLQLLWLAGFVQVAIAFANLFLPTKLKYRENLSRVSPIIRQIFVVHSVYIVGVVLLIAAVTFGFAGELASGHGLGRFLAAAIAVFWLLRAPIQLLYYDATLRKENRWGDIAFTAGALFLAATYGAASFAHGM